MRGLHQLLDELHPLAKPGYKALINLVGETDVALEEQVIELGFVLFELLDIFLEEIKLAGVELLLEKATEELFGQLIADFRLGQVPTLQIGTHQLGNQPVLLSRDRLGRQQPSGQKQGGAGS